MGQNLFVAAALLSSLLHGEDVMPERAKVLDCIQIEVLVRVEMSHDYSCFLVQTNGVVNLLGVFIIISNRCLNVRCRKRCDKVSQ